MDIKELYQQNAQAFTESPELFENEELFSGFRRASSNTMMQLGGEKKQRTIGLAETTPSFKAEGTATWLGDAGIGMTAGSIFKSAYEAWDDDPMGGTANPHFDPEYNAVEAKEAVEATGYDQETTAAMDEILGLGVEDPLAASAIKRLGQSNSWEHTKAVVRRYQQQKKMIQDADDADMLAWGTGFAGGLAGDILTTLALGNFAGAIGVGGRGVQVTKTIMGAKAAAAGRLGLLAAAEGTAQFAFENVFKDNLTASDAVVAAGLPFLFGGLIGGAFPDKMVGVFSKEGFTKADEADRAARQLAARSRATGDGSAGAAEANVSRLDAAAETTEAMEEMIAPELPHGYGPFKSWVVGESAGAEFLSRHIPFFRAWRSPESMATSKIGAAQKMAEKGQRSKGMDMIAAYLGKTYQFTIGMKNDFLGMSRGSSMVADVKRLENLTQTKELEATATYQKFRNDVYPNWIRARADIAKNNWRNSSKNVGALNEREFTAYADQYIQSIHDNTPEATQRILAKIEARVPPESMPKVEKWLRQQGDLYDDYYMQMGELEARYDLISKEDLKPGYRPQNWDPEKISGAPQLFEAQLANHLSGPPDIDWVRDNAPHEVRVTKDAAGAEVEVTTSIMRTDDDGNIVETWEEFLQREPEEALKLQNEWNAQRQEDKLVTAQNLQKEVHREARALGFKRATDAIEAHADVIAKMEARRDFHAEKLTKTFAETGERVPVKGTQGEWMTAIQLGAERTRLGTIIDRIDAAMDAQNALFKDLKMAVEREKFNADSSAGRMIRDAQGRVTGFEMAGKPLDEVLATKGAAARRVGLDAKGRRAAAKQERHLKRVDASVARASAKASMARIRSEVREMVDAMRGRKAVGGFESDKLIQTSRHMKRRVIDLSGVRDLDEWQRFMYNDPILIAHRYNNAMSRVITLRKHFAPFLRARGMIDDDVDLNTVDITGNLKKVLQDEFADDYTEIAEQRRTGKITEKEATKRTKFLQRAERESEELFDRVMGEHTRSDYMKDMDDIGAVNFDRGLHLGMVFTAIQTMGWIVASQIGDAVMLSAAGGKILTGLKSLVPVTLQTVLRQPRQFDEIMKHDPEMAFTMAGANVRSMSLMNNRFDLEPDLSALDFPGSKYRTIARGMESVAHMEYWANFMHPMNRIVRESFGVDFLHQIGQDMQKFTSLSPRMKAFYQRLGISADEAVEMGDLMRKYNIKARGKLRIPDFKKWDNPKLERKFRDAQLQAGHEAMMDPNIGDRPFLRRKPMGRMILQFSSFMYTSGNKFYKPMVQNAMMSPEGSARMAFFVMSALGLSGLSEMMRAGRSDGLEGMEKKMEDLFVNPNGIAWNRAFMRSPLVLGMSGAAYEAIEAPFAKSINEGLGVEMLDTEFNRLQMSRGLPGLVTGALGGNLNAAYRALEDVAEGDAEALKKWAAYKTPIVNTMPAWVLFGIYDKYGD